MNFYQKIGIILIVFVSASAVFLWRYLAVDLPNPDHLYQHVNAASTNIYDRNGVLLYQITDPHQGQHTPLALDDIPPACIDATLATEDANFYRNPGFDTKAMFRALAGNLWHGEIISGASTITQQLARNLLLSPAERNEVSLTRKAREIILAWRITRKFSKDEILTLYLNETYYGNLAFGIEAASNIYFGKNAATLDTAECALLAGLPQSPVLYNPLENPATAKARQSDVLSLMEKHKLLSPADATLARAEKLQFVAVPFPIKAPHFVMYVRGQLEKRFGLEALYTQGLQVFTTLDLDMQNTARDISQRQLEKLADSKDGLPPKNIRNAAVVILQPRTGEVLAMLGSPNYFDSRIDGAVNAAVALRQPGSSIKPITYAAAFDPNFAKSYGYAPLSPASMMMDVRTAFVTKEGNPYVPQNYDRKWHGPVLLRQALASSYNLIAVKVLDYVGIKAMTDLARQMGITTFDDAERFGLALTLGGGEVRLLELTAAYATFANGGAAIEPVTITKVVNAAGDTLYRRAPQPLPQILDPRTVYLITDILSDNYARAGAFGEGSMLRLNRPAAAKTGTTTDFRDNWTLGYTPDFVVGVWAGNADNESMRHVSGITGAAPIWHDVMMSIHRNLPAHNFVKPSGISTQTICAVNGLLPSDGCKRTLTEIFIEGTEPTQTDNWHVKRNIDRRNGLLASETCPAEYVTTRYFTQYPTDAAQWISQSVTRQMPTEFSPLCENSRQLSVVSEQPAVETRSMPAIKFISPDKGASYQISTAIPAELQKLRVAVQLSPNIDRDSVQLMVNGKLLTHNAETLWNLQPGAFEFTAIGVDFEGKVVRENIEINVN